MTYLDTLQNAFETVGKCIKDSIEKTEDDLNFKFSDDQKKLCIGFALLYLSTKYGK